MQLFKTDFRATMVAMSLLILLSYHLQVAAQTSTSFHLTSMESLANRSLDLGAPGLHALPLTFVYKSPKAGQIGWKAILQYPAAWGSLDTIEIPTAQGWKLVEMFQTHPVGDSLARLELHLARMVNYPIDVQIVLQFKDPGIGNRINQGGIVVSDLIEGWRIAPGTQPEVWPIPSQGIIDLKAPGGYNQVQLLDPYQQVQGLWSVNGSATLDLTTRHEGIYHLRFTGPGMPDLYKSIVLKP